MGVKTKQLKQTVKVVITKGDVTRTEYFTKPEKLVEWVSKKQKEGYTYVSETL